MGLPVARRAFRIRLLRPGAVRAIARLATFADAAEGCGACPVTHSGPARWPGVQTDASAVIASVATLVMLS